MVKKLLVVIVAGIMILAPPLSDVLAQTAETIQVNYEEVNPVDGFNYGLKRIREKLYLVLLFFSKDKKADYYNKLVNKRLAELKYVIEQKDMANFEHATTRYSTTVGMWVDYILEKKLADRKQPAVETLTSYKPVVEILMGKYDPTTAEWRFVKQDLDYLQIYIDKLR